MPPTGSGGQPWRQSAATVRRPTGRRVRVRRDSVRVRIVCRRVRNGHGFATMPPTVCRQVRAKRAAPFLWRSRAPGRRSRVRIVCRNRADGDRFGTVTGSGGATVPPCRAYAYMSIARRRSRQRGNRSDGHADRFAPNAPQPPAVAFPCRRRVRAVPIRRAVPVAFLYAVATVPPWQPWRQSAATADGFGFAVIRFGQSADRFGRFAPPCRRQSADGQGDGATADGFGQSADRFGRFAPPCRRQSAATVRRPTVTPTGSRPFRFTAAPCAVPVPSDGATVATVCRRVRTGDRFGRATVRRPTGRRGNRADGQGDGATADGFAPTGSATVPTVTGSGTVTGSDGNGQRFAASRFPRPAVRRGNRRQVRNGHGFGRATGNGSATVPPFG